MIGCEANVVFVDVQVGGGVVVDEVVFEEEVGVVG